MDALRVRAGRCLPHEVLPLGQGSRAAGLVGLSIDEVAFGVEVIVDVGMDGGELL